MQNPIMSMHKHLHSKATYPLRVHQFTTQQGCEGGKKRNEFIHHTNLIFSMHKHVYSKATYLLRVHRFTTQQVGKKVIGGMNFHSSNKPQSQYARTCSFKGNLPAKNAPVHNTTSG